MAVWYNEPIINIVLEKIRELTKGGSVPIREDELLSALERDGYSISNTDLAKALIRLELLGVIYVVSSGKDEKGSRNIKLVRRTSTSSALQL